MGQQVWLDQDGYHLIVRSKVKWCIVEVGLNCGPVKIGGMLILIKIFASKSLEWVSTLHSSGD